MSSFIEEINFKVVPHHIAIIPDGNVRWAKSKNISSEQGHRKGVEVLENILDYCQNINIKIASIYAFSSENWKRPILERQILFNLIEEFFEKKIPKIIKKKARIKIIGNISAFNKKIKSLILDAQEVSKNNNDFLIQIALNYGGRQEILNACKMIANHLAEKNQSFDEIDDRIFNEYLYTNNIPDPDLLIRTGDTYRISNFLLYQIAYTEFYFFKKLWPDINLNDIKKAIKDFSERQRNFGGRS